MNADTQCPSNLFDSGPVCLVGLSFYERVGGMSQYLECWTDVINNEIQCCVATYSENSSDKCLSLPYFRLSKKIDYWWKSVASLFFKYPVRQLAQRISKICNDNGCSVVYFIDVTLYTGELLRQIAEISPHIKIILTVHDPIPHLESKTKLALFLEKKNNLKILNLTNRKSVFIHVHSKSLVQGSFLEGCQNLVEAPHPIPDRVYSDEFRIHPRLDYAMPQRKINIGFMGRIEEYKGLSLLYQSFYYLASKEPHLTNHLKITICGRGHIADEWTSLPYEITIINSGITDEIFHKNLLNLDLLVLPYLEATQSGVAVLANAYEIPMIATDVGIIKDTLVIDQHNGIIIKPNNVDMLTEKIREFVINQSLAVMLTQNARKPFD